MATNGDEIVGAYAYQIIGVSFDGDPGRDTFEFLGGGAFDSTQSVAFTNFEIITGGVAPGRVRIRGSQLRGVETIDGGGGTNLVFLDGPLIDLTGKSVNGFDGIVLSMASVTVMTDDLTASGMPASMVWPQRT